MNLRSSCWLLSLICVGSLASLVILAPLINSSRAGLAQPATLAAPAKPAFEDARIDPLAAEYAGLWDIAKPAATVKRIAFEDFKFDPLLAGKSGLWDIKPSAGHRNAPAR